MDKLVITASSHPRQKDREFSHVPPLHAVQIGEKGGVQSQGWSKSSDLFGGGGCWLCLLFLPLSEKELGAVFTLTGGSVEATLPLLI